jgi:hypothetical protein
MLALLILAGLAGSIQGQNLLQNPGFESPEGWDHLWILSMTDPSSASALADPITSDVHEGERSVEITNKVKLKWTYLYSDSVNAPIALRAGKKYEVKGWLKILEQGKETDLSIFWNGSTESLNFYSENPDPDTHPDWFMVKDTIYPTTNCLDGYVRLGFRTDREGLFPVGNILMDDFSVERIPEDSDTDILEVEVEQQASPAQIDNMAATIRLALESGTKVSEVVLALIEVSPGAKVTPASGEVVDLSGPAVFTVTAKDGVTTRDWNVEVEVLPSNETEIIGFTLPGQTGLTGIDASLHQVDVHVPFGTDLSALVPDISVSPGATVDPSSGSAADFSSPVLFTVTAEDGTTQQTWTVNVSETAPSTDANIVGFEIPDQIGATVIDEVSHTISLVVPFGLDVTELIPAVEISAGAVIDPGNAVPADFSNPVEYLVTAQDGTTQQDWMVTVRQAPNNAAEIISFTMPGQVGASHIDADLHTILVELPFGTDLTSLTPDIELSAGASSNPADGVAADYTQPVIYTVTAQDGTTSVAWTVQVILMDNTATEILGFNLAVQEGETVINDQQKVVTVRVPDQTDVTSLIPSIEVSSGARVNPESGLETDFTNPVVYVVTAADGITTEIWIVQVVVLENTAAEITGFSLPEQTAPAMIDTDTRTISLEVSPGTDVSSLRPEIELSAGATVDPASGALVDFSTWVILTVTAEDGTTKQEWLVLVNVADDATGTADIPHDVIRIYPNPASSYLIVEMEETGGIYLHDLNGRIVYSASDVHSRTTIPVSAFERGMYLLTVQSGPRREVFKVMIE